MIDLYVLLAIMIIGAIAAIEMPDLLSAVVAVGVVGLGFALASLALRAPDVAITQLVVEIIGLVVLIRATIRVRLPGTTTASRIIAAGVALLFVACLVCATAGALRELPPFGSPIMAVSGEYAFRAVKETGATNVVDAVLLDFRAYDTLGEATVLLTAVLGVLAISRRTGRKTLGNPPEHENE